MTAKRRYLSGPRLTRPRLVPRRIPLRAWRRAHWLDTGRRGHKPRLYKRDHAWFHLWRLWSLARARGKGSKAWKAYHAALTDAQKLTDGEKVAATARQLAALYGTTMPYTMGLDRDDWLVAGINPPRPPIRTDCSGFTRLCYWINHLPDPSGLAWRWLGWTGTTLSFAAAHGRTTTDVSQARPGDIIVIGAAPGAHEVVTLESGRDPLVASHGHVGVQIQHLSVDTREPKTVCQSLRGVRLG